MARLGRGYAALPHVRQWFQGTAYDINHGNLLTHVSTASPTLTTSAIDTTGATVLVACIGDYALAAAATLSDSKSNSWTPLTESIEAFDNRIRLFYAANPTVGTGHTFTLNLGTSAPALCVAAFSGVNITSPFDVQNGATSATTAVHTQQTGSITPNYNEELVICGVSVEGAIGASLSIDNNFSVIDQIDFSTGVTFGASLAYVYQTTATAMNPTWTWTGDFITVAAIASFKTIDVAVGTKITRGYPRGIQRGYPRRQLLVNR